MSVMGVGECCFNICSNQSTKVFKSKNLFSKRVGSNSSVAGLPFLEREVERSKPRVVCYEALVVGALNVTTILFLFDKK